MSRCLLRRDSGSQADPNELTALGAQYGHSFKIESVPELLDRFGLRIGDPLPGGWRP